MICVRVSCKASICFFALGARPAYSALSLAYSSRSMMPSARLSYRDTSSFWSRSCSRAFLVELPLHLLASAVLRGRYPSWQEYRPDQPRPGYTALPCPKPVVPALRPVSYEGEQLFACLCAEQGVDVFLLPEGRSCTYFAPHSPQNSMPAEKLHGAVAEGCGGYPTRAPSVRAVKVPALNDGFVGVRKRLPIRFPAFFDALSHFCWVVFLNEVPV